MNSSKRFHYHLALKLFIDDKEWFEELQSAYGRKDEAGGQSHMHVTELLLSQMDNMVGFNSVSEDETDKVNCDEPPNTPELPDKEFFKNLGVNC